MTIYHELNKLLDQGMTVAVATITDVKGSVPREVGAKMIIHPLGKHVGTIGGGCGEALLPRQVRVHPAEIGGELHGGVLRDGSGGESRRAARAAPR